LISDPVSGHFNDLFIYRSLPAAMPLYPVIDRQLAVKNEPIQTLWTESRAASQKITGYFCSE
jgi:hypothetical protein